jgi:hypothetical protein
MVPPCSSRRTTGLSAITILGVLLPINVVVCRVGDLAEIHAAPTPVGSKAARFDACEFDAPLGFYFFGYGLCESFDCPLTGTVDGKAWNAFCRSAIEIIPR